MGRFSIEEFKSQIDRNGGFAKPNRFFVSLVPPPVIARTFGNRLEYYCEAVNLPGYQLQTTDYRRYTYGPNEKRPFAPHSNPLQMTIMADGKGIMWRFFQMWMSEILEHNIDNGINPDNSLGIEFPGGVRGAAAANPYELKYKVEYVTNIAIYHVPESWDGSDQLSKFTTRTVCFDAFPSNIVDMPLSWSDNNNIARFGVQLEYLDFHYGYVREG